MFSSRIFCSLASSVGVLGDAAIQEQLLYNGVYITRNVRYEKADIKVSPENF